MTPATMRLFVAVAVPARVRAVADAAVAPARDAAPDLAWTRSDGWHLTLAFLGRVDDDRVPEVDAVVAGSASAAAPVDLSLGAPGRFGGRVLWLAVADDPSGALASLAETIQAGLAAAGLPVDRRPVTPHLTLARARRGRSAVDAGVVSAVAPAQSTWCADDVRLYRSHLGRGGARYEVVTASPLAASPA